MIVAVDFDGTLQVKDAHGKLVPNIKLMTQLAAGQSRGDIVILWTCREGKRLAEAVNYCRRHGFCPNYVNCNAPAAVRMMGHDSRKIYADVYIDDKNVR